MLDIAAVQAALNEQKLDGWLLYDFRGLNVLARRVLGFAADAHATRRWFYFIPAQGEPLKLVHRIESGMLDFLPGEKIVYLRWQELEAGVETLVNRRKRLAMEYVPRNANPYVSRVDAGTVELVRSFGPDVVSSGDLIQLFEAVWTEAQWQMHLEASKHTRSAYDVAFDFIRTRCKNGGSVRESEVQQLIMDHFKKHKMVTDHPPIVGVNEHSGDPHYATTPDTDTAMKTGDFVLVDLWAKLDQPQAVYSDLTWTAFIGTETPTQIEQIFNIVAAGRDAAIEAVKTAFAEKKPILGWQVDHAARSVIHAAGFGQYFCHRLGHSIGQETHGNGANMDGLETREERRVLPRTCFSIEPGIYLPQFGVRSEVDVYVDKDCRVHVTGGELQKEVVLLG